jgi:integrase/recombinase XerD
LVAYLDTRKHDPLGRPLFLSQKGGAFSPNSLQRLFSTLYQDLAGIEGATSHSGRRTFATNLLSGGANIKELQVLMGHSSINTTAIYVQEDPERLANLVRKLK